MKPSAKPPSPHASDAIRANLRRRPGRPASATGRKEVDLAARVRLLKAMLLGGGSGGFLGLLAGTLLGHPFLGALLGALGIGLGSRLVSEKVGGAAHVVYAGSVRSMTPARNYSRAEALAVRGHYDDAIDVY